MQCGAAQACYQPITGQAWQSWGLGEGRGGRKRLITITAHAQCGCGERGCGAVKSACVHAEMGGCLTPFLFLRPRGNHTMFVLLFFFVPHDLQIFFSSFETFFLPSLPPLDMWAAFLPGRKGKTAVAAPSSSPLTKELCKQEIQIRCRWVEEPGSKPNTSPLTRKKKRRNLTGAARAQPNPALQSGFKSGNFSLFHQPVYSKLHQQNKYY